MKGLSVVLIAMLVSVVTAAGTVYVLERTQLLPPPAPEQVNVPRLVGLSEADARTNLDASGLKPLIDGREAVDGAAPGTVARQAPAAGQPLRRGGAVSLTIATRMPLVPDVLGQEISAATRALQDAGYAVELGEPVASPDQAEGLVSVQSPVAGSPLARQGTVVLRASAGPASVEVPKLLGLSLDEAKARAEAARIALDVKWISRAETRTYVVLRQRPEPGETQAPGSPVEVVINR